MIPDPPGSRQPEPVPDSDATISDGMRAVEACMAGGIPGMACEVWITVRWWRAARHAARRGSEQVFPGINGHVRDVPSFGVGIPSAA